MIRLVRGHAPLRMVKARACEPGREPDRSMAGAADVLAAMAMTACLAGLGLGAVIGLAALAAWTTTAAASAVADVMLRASPPHVPTRPVPRRIDRAASSL